MSIMPRYPVYVPSKGRYDYCNTAKVFIRDQVQFYLVVEPQEQDFYAVRFGAERLLVLPWEGDDEKRKQFTAERKIENGGLIAARNWIKEHAITNGHERHWQIDDNTKQGFYRYYKGNRVRCPAGVALATIEDFVDRYENVALAGMNYTMFAPSGQRLPPFQLNCHVYSCSLVLNSLPHRWRLTYNDDTDMCLQVLADGWCTVLFNVFLFSKMPTMKVKGGNTDDLYQGDGRLKMARSLEKMWPGIVETKRRYGRPQHVVKDAWKRFDTPLKLKPGIKLGDFEKVDERGMKLAQVENDKRERVNRFFEQYRKEP